MIAITQTKYILVFITEEKIMKMFKRVFALALVLAMSLSLVACGSSIEGSWVYEEKGQKIIYTFEEDGKGEMSVLGIKVDMTYEVDGDEVTITTEVAGEKDTQTFNFEVDGDTLTLESDGEKAEFTRE